MKSRLAKVAAVLAPLALLAFLGWHLAGTIRLSPAPVSSPSPSAPTLPRKSFTICAAGCRYTGVALPAMNRASLAEFTRAARNQPRIVETYQAFGRPFPSAWTHILLARKILPLIQIDPVHAPLGQIAAGRYDAYLTAYGHAVAALGAFPVALSFAHEQNGTWYPWGCKHTPPQVFIAAYRHVETIIRHAGAHHVIWVWTANVALRGGARCPLMARWPGKAYVTWVGLDGYLRTQRNTYARDISPSVSLVAGLGKPILLCETGVLLGVPGATSRILDIYRGAAHSPGLIGVVYFDSRTAKFGDYRPQDNPATLAAFRQATTRYRNG